MNYKHTQFGWVILVCCAVSLAIIFGVEHSMTAEQQRHFPAWLVTAVVGAVMILFASLTVEVNDHLIQLRFGPGLIHWKFRLADVVKCQPVRNRWWMGWGIHGWPGPRGGWLFNVSGWDAVELKMKNGKIYRIGTDEPGKLAEFIQAKLCKVI